MRLEVFLENLGKANEGYMVGKYVRLPINENDFEKVLEEIGIDNINYEEYFITDVESDIDGMSKYIHEYTSIKTLNELAERLDNLSEADTIKFMAIIEAELFNGLEHIIETLDDLEKWELYYNVNNDEDLGYYYIEELSALSIPENISPYFDYERYGRDVRLELNGTFTSYGFVNELY